MAVSHPGISCMYLLGIRSSLLFQSKYRLEQIQGRNGRQFPSLTGASQAGISCQAIHPRNIRFVMISGGPGARMFFFAK